jgi:diguanylate cyclase (GGDEF)-like protein
MPFFNTTRLNALEAQPKIIPQHLILVVDDEAANRQAIRALLDGQYQILEAADGLAALRLIEQLPDKSQLACIISDQRMPNVTGVELFERVLPLLPRTIRIIVTGFIDVNAIVNAVNRAHIYQFFIKPFDPHDFILTIQRAVETFELNKKLDAYHAQLEARVAERTYDLEQAYRDLELASFTDPLTGLRNRRFLLHKIAADVRLNDENNSNKLIFMLLDIDHFKSVNDTYGHLAGDRLLVQISDRLHQFAQPGDHLIRWGGEEFLLILSQARHNDASAAAERIRKLIGTDEFDLSNDIRLRKTCSIGFACMPFTQQEPDLLSWEQVIELADHALYMAKNGGRDAWVGFFANPSLHSNVPVRQLLRAGAEIAAAGHLRIVSNLLTLQRGLP